MNFRRAERKRAKLRLALAGPSGSGKTYSALLIAKGIGGPVAVIDTELGSSELYADHPDIGLDFDVSLLGPPYTPERYVELIKKAADKKYNVVIIDSLSHMWSGEGGLLEMVDQAAKANRGNSFAGWRAVRPHEKKALNALLRTDIHIIAAMRTKTAWEVEKDERTGKTRPVKIGLKPEQREGLEYEFTTVFDMAVDGNIASASKDRTSLYKGRYFVPTEQTGNELLIWLESGAEPDPINEAYDPDNWQGDNLPQGMTSSRDAVGRKMEEIRNKYEENNRLNEGQIKLIRDILRSNFFSDEERIKAEEFCRDSRTTKDQGARFVGRLKKLYRERKKAAEDQSQQTSDEQDGGPDTTEPGPDSELEEQSVEPDQEQRADGDNLKENQNEKDEEAVEDASSDVTSAADETDTAADQKEKDSFEDEELEEWEKEVMDNLAIPVGNRAEFLKWAGSQTALEGADLLDDLEKNGDMYQTAWAQD